MNTTIALIILLFFACYLIAYLWWEVTDKEKKISELVDALKEAQEQADRYYPANQSAYTEMAETMRSAIEEVYGPELTKED